MTRATLIQAATALRPSFLEPDVRAVLSAFLEEITKAVASGRTVQIRGFATFYPVQREAKHWTRNVRTGEPAPMPAHKTMKARMKMEIPNAPRT